MRRSEYVGNEPHRLFEVDLFPVRRADPCPFLSAVLQGVKTEVGEIGSLGVVEHTEYAAFLVDIMSDPGT